MERDMECLLRVRGDAAFLNTFDSLFRSTPGPQWPDRESGEAPRYSLHGLCPVPENVRRRGYETAGKLWCKKAWGVEDDLWDMQARRRLGERCYRYYTTEGKPQNALYDASVRFPALTFQLAFQSRNWEIERHSFRNGQRQSTYSHQTEDGLAPLREEMGF